MADVIRGPWRDRPDIDPRASAVLPFRWRSKNPIPLEDRRNTTLDAKPHCKVCRVLFARDRPPPADRLCRLCRSDIEDNTTPDDPALF